MDVKRFNKDLEEIKNNQYIMNNAINEIKNALEGTNSRIMDAEDTNSEVEDRMVEINESERKKEKTNKKKRGQSQRPPGQYETLQHSNYRSPRRRRQKERS